VDSDILSVVSYFDIASLSVVACCGKMQFLAYFTRLFSAESELPPLVTVCQVARLAAGSAFSAAYDSSPERERRGKSHARFPSLAKLQKSAFIGVANSAACTIIFTTASLFVGFPTVLLVVSFSLRSTACSIIVTT
jgi:hypothetical protein